MNFIELFLIALGLAMDAFAVSVCLGLKMKGPGIRKALIVGAYFGSFQMGMALIGYFAAGFFADMITEYDHWIAFILLSLIGALMIKEAFGKEKEEEDVENGLHPAKMLSLSVATSIDSLAVGISFAFLGETFGLGIGILGAAVVIGAVTFAVSVLGTKTGNIFGTGIKRGAEIAGGIILILIGVKILLEHLDVIGI